MVHGDCVSIGCYAMTDEGIEEIYNAVERALDTGQQVVDVHIFPFRMTEENLRQLANSPWYSFWQNLQEGYQLFEADKIPPKASTTDGRYLFNQ